MTLKERFQRYCQWTSLHGFNFFVYPERSCGRALFWLVIILLSAGLGLFVVGTNIGDFASSTVSYDLDTPTLSLDGVFFPSLVLCNMNQMRSSFVWALVKDPIMKGRTFMEIHQLLEKVFVKV